jgi:hypothetical protein
MRGPQAGGMSQQPLLAPGRRLAGAAPPRSHMGRVLPSGRFVTWHTVQAGVP